MAEARVDRARVAANDPRGVLAVLKLSRTSYRRMVQNLGWATGYNLLAVPVAAGALAWAGVTRPRPSASS